MFFTIMAQAFCSNLGISWVFPFGAIVMAPSQSKQARSAKDRKVKKSIEKGEKVTNQDKQEKKVKNEAKVKDAQDRKGCLRTSVSPGSTTASSTGIPATRASFKQKPVYVYTTPKKTTAAVVSPPPPKAKGSVKSEENIKNLDKSEKKGKEDTKKHAKASKEHEKIEKDKEKHTETEQSKSSSKLLRQKTCKGFEIPVPVGRNHKTGKDLKKDDNHEETGKKKRKRVKDEKFEKDMDELDATDVEEEEEGNVSETDEENAPTLELGPRSEKGDLSTSSAEENNEDEDEEEEEEEESDDQEEEDSEGEVEDEEEDEKQEAKVPAAKGTLEQKGKDIAAAAASGLEVARKANSDFDTLFLRLYTKFYGEVCLESKNLFILVAHH